MPPCSHPPEPIPEPLRGRDNPSFARETILHRLPRIARVTLEENDFPPGTVENLHRLIAEIPHGPVRPIHAPLAPDAALWEQYTRPYLGQDWLEIPWFFAEWYFYARILEATGYYAPGPSRSEPGRSGPGRGVDPFGRQKQASLAAALQGPGHAVQDLVVKQEALLDGPPSRAQEAFSSLLSLDLAGNQVDLSRWPGAEGLALQTNRERILVDHSREVGTFLFDVGAPHAGDLGARTGKRVDFLIDNAGFELVADLCLADFLLHRQAAPQIVFHLKQQPTFVSDATVPDVHAVLDTLAQQPDSSLPAFAGRIRDHLEHDRLELRADPFWTSPLPMWEAPAPLLAGLNGARLVMSKGDAHYRRLLGDRHWLPTTPFASIVCFLDTPVLALRTLKSEVVSGLQPGQAEKAQAEDPGWMTDGRWALIQWTGGENTV